MTNNILTLALIGGGAYLAYNYYQKRNNNKGVANGNISNGAKSPVSEDVLIAEMEEEGEEGMAVEYGNANDGWDSDNVSYGL